MKIDFVYSQNITDKEYYEELPEGDYLKDYSDTVLDILTKAEANFPEFAQDTGTTVTVYFMDNPTIREINRDEREVDRPTDVLSFPFLDLHEGDGSFSEYDLHPENGAIMIGEILISVDKVKEQAEEYGHSERREVAFLSLHGFLHLMGYDHIEKEDEMIMMPLAEKILHEAGYDREN